MKKLHYEKRVKGPNNLKISQRRKEIKAQLIKKNGQKCGYCFHKERKLTLDHIQPLSKGGEDKIHNIILTCEECNQLKGDMDIDEWLKFIGWE